MKISKSRLKQIIKEEMAAMAEKKEVSEEQRMINAKIEGGLFQELDKAGMLGVGVDGRAVARYLRMAMAQSPEDGEQIKTITLRYAKQGASGPKLIQLLKKLIAKRAKRVAPAKGDSTPDANQQRIMRQAKERRAAAAKEKQTAGGTGRPGGN